MTQTSTTRFQWRTAPGAILSPAGERETESMFSPYTMQQLTLTLAGADPFVADATVTYVFPLQDGSGNNGTFSVLIPDTTTLAAAAALVAAAWNASPQAYQLYTATSNAAIVTLVARSANTSILAAAIVGTFTDAHTSTTAQSVAAAAPALQFGLWYIYGSIVQPLAISGTPRDANPAVVPNSGTVIADLRGIVAREVNSTMLTIPTSLATPDVYPAGYVWPGLLRGQVCARVDPASATMTGGPTQQVHVVIAAGVYSVIGAVAAAADGGNTIRVDNAPTGNILARAISREENLSPFTTSSGRFVPLKLNRTN